MSSSGIVSRLFIYPVKSCRGLALPEVEVTGRGWAFDREWMVTDSDGGFLTQRQQPRLALVEPALTASALRLRAPGMTPLEIPLVPDRASPDCSIRVWEFAGTALDEGNTPATWFSQYLGVPSRLVRWKPSERRLSSPDWTDGIAAENRFSDGFPVLVLSEASLADLNARRAPAAPLPMDRFRPNLVLGNVAAYAEDHFRSLEVDGTELRLVKPCARCQITTTDQQTALVDGSDPLRALATYRRDPRLPGVMFGQNALVKRGLGHRLRVGMTVRLLE